MIREEVEVTGLLGRFIFGLQFRDPVQSYQRDVDGDELSFEVSAPKSSIGRGPSNQIVIPDNSLSTRHAEDPRGHRNVGLADFAAGRDFARIEHAYLLPGRGKLESGAAAEQDCRGSQDC